MFKGWDKDFCSFPRKTFQQEWEIFHFLLPDNSTSLKAVCPLLFFPLEKINHRDSKQELCWHQEMEGNEEQPSNSI